MEDYGSFAKFYSAREAEPLTELLKAEKIPFRLEKERNQLDEVIIGQNLDPMFVVSIPANYFDKVSRLLESENPDNEPTTAPYRNGSSIPESVDSQWIFIGYLLSIIPFAGLLSGVVILSSKKRSADGSRIYMYDARSRFHGKIMITAGILSSVIYFCVRLIFA